VSVEISAQSNNDVYMHLQSCIVWQDEAELRGNCSYCGWLKQLPKVYMAFTKTDTALRFAAVARQICILSFHDLLEGAV
jgi:hypothetical protein